MREALRRVVWRSSAIGVLATVAATLLAGPEIGWGVMVGAGLSTANLAVLAWIGRHRIDEADEPDERYGAMMALLVGKMTLLLVVAFVAMAVFGVHPIGFAIGYSVFMVAACWEVLDLRPGASR
jgi:hypothetical protein